MIKFIENNKMTSVFLVCILASFIGLIVTPRSDEASDYKNRNPDICINNDGLKEFNVIRVTKQRNIGIAFCNDGNVKWGK